MQMSDRRTASESMAFPRQSRFSFTSAWTLVLAVLLLCMAAPSHAQQIRFEGLVDYGFDWSRIWVDINNDGKDDHCVLAGGNAERLECYLSDGSTFTRKVFSPGDGKYPGSLRFVDIDGDGQVDFCRGNGGTGSSISLACYRGPAFTQIVASATIPVAYCEPIGQDTCIPHGGVAGQGWDTAWYKLNFADVNGDGLPDLCYPHEVWEEQVPYYPPPIELRCMISTGSSFGSATSAWIQTSFDPGLDNFPRGFYDFNGDGFPDYCRVLDAGGHLRCTVSGPNGFVGEITTSTAPASPHREGATFVDINGDGKTDYCRIVGPTGNFKLSCLISNGIGWEATERTSDVLDPGDGQYRWWVDINGDGFPDFCRFKSGTVSGRSGTFACRLSRGDGEGTGPTATNAFVFSDIELPNTDVGAPEGRSFCDASGTGIVTICRQTVRTFSTGEECYEGQNGIMCYPTTANAYGLWSGFSDVIQARQPLMTAFSDGLGAETRITYMPMSSALVYTKSGPSSYPRAVLEQPRSPVVYESRAWIAGSSATLTGNARYQYRNLVSDRWAGSRGFRERWMLNEGSNVLDHVVYYQGLGPAVDASSVLNDANEIGQIKCQLRYAINAGSLMESAQSASSQLPAREQTMEHNMSVAKVPSAASPSDCPAPPASSFTLLQSTRNTLADTIPVNPRFRYIGASTMNSWDWDGTSAVLLPTVTTSTKLDDVGNVTELVQTTTDSAGRVWNKKTTNIYAADNRSSWLIGRLTKARVESTAPSLDTQIAANARSAGSSPNADTTSGPYTPPPPSSPPPLSPAAMGAILQLLLDE